MPKTVEQKQPLSLIMGAECPSCGRDNSEEAEGGEVCTSEDCPGVQLYAAAPDLLAALEGLIERYVWRTGLRDPLDVAAIESARAAIKQAKRE